MGYKQIYVLRFIRVLERVDKQIINIKKEKWVVLFSMSFSFNAVWHLNKRQYWVSEDAMWHIFQSVQSSSLICLSNAPLLLQNGIGEGILAFWIRVTAPHFLSKKKWAVPHYVLGVPITCTQFYNINKKPNK